MSRITPWESGITIESPGWTPNSRWTCGPPSTPVVPFFFTASVARTVGRARPSASIRASSSRASVCWVNSMSNAITFAPASRRWSITTAW
jgi:hypothetical protein